MAIKKKKKVSNKNRLREGFKKWTAYYRRMPHRFAEDYLGVKLFLYQKILLWAMNKYNFFMYIAARGQGNYLLQYSSTENMINL